MDGIPRCQRSIPLRGHTWLNLHHHHAVPLRPMRRRGQDREGKPARGDHARSPRGTFTSWQTRVKYHRAPTCSTTSSTLPTNNPCRLRALSFTPYAGPLFHRPTSTAPMLCFNSVMTHALSRRRSTVGRYLCALSRLSPMSWDADALLHNRTRSAFIIVDSGTGTPSSSSLILRIAAFFHSDSRQPQRRNRTAALRIPSETFTTGNVATMSVSRRSARPTLLRGCLQRRKCVCTLHLSLRGRRYMPTLVYAGYTLHYTLNLLFLHVQWVD